MRTQLKLIVLTSLVNHMKHFLLINDCYFFFFCLLNLYFKSWLLKYLMFCNSAMMSRYFFIINKPCCVTIGLTMVIPCVDKTTVYSTGLREFNVPPQKVGTAYLSFYGFSWVITIWRNASTCLYIICIYKTVWINIIFIIRNSTPKLICQMFYDIDQLVTSSRKKHNASLPVRSSVYNADVLIYIADVLV